MGNNPRLIASYLLLSAAVVGTLACYSGLQYFTTWALVIHAVVFGGCFAARLVWKPWKFRWHWVLAPGLTISLSVASAALVLFWDCWDETYADFCADGQVKACGELAVGFVLVHYVPPLLYTIFFIWEQDCHYYKTPRPKLSPYFYFIALVQISTLPASLYRLAFNIREVYGGDSSTGPVTTYVITTMFSSAVLASRFG